MAGNLVGGLGRLLKRADWMSGVTQGAKYAESSGRNHLKRLLDAVGYNEVGAITAPTDRAGVVNEYFAAAKDKNRILEAADAAVQQGKLGKDQRSAVRRGFSAAERTAAAGDAIAAHIDDALPTRVRKVDASGYSPPEGRFLDLSTLSTHPADIMGTAQRSLLLPVSDKFSIDEFVEMFSPDRVRKMDKAARGGAEIGGTHWYNMAPIYKKMVGMFGEDVGAEMFKKWAMDNAVLSPRSGVVDQTIRESQLNYFLNREGRWPTNKELSSAQDMYGHLAHDVHLGGLNRIRERGDVPKTGEKPKIGSYVENYFGNWDPGTMDTHHFAIAGLSRQRPTPVKAYNSKTGEYELKLGGDGEPLIQMVSEPIGKFYSPLELATRQMAAKHGIDPAAEQAAVWTGLARDPSLLGGTTKKFAPRTSAPYADIFDQVIRESAAVRGKSADDMFRDAMLRDDYFTRDAGAAKKRTLKRGEDDPLAAVEDFRRGGLVSMHK